MVREANSMRVVCTSWPREGREEHWWTIYSDGRQYKDGKFEPIDLHRRSGSAAAWRMSGSG